MLNVVNIVLIIALTILLIIPCALTAGTFAGQMRQISSDEDRAIMFLKASEALRKCKSRFNALRMAAIRRLVITFSILFGIYAVCLGVVLLISWGISLLIG